MVVLTCLVYLQSCVPTMLALTLGLSTLWGPSKGCCIFNFHPRMPTHQVRRALINVHGWQHLACSRDTFNDSNYLATSVLTVVWVLSVPLADVTHAVVRGNRHGQLPTKPCRVSAPGMTETRLLSGDFPQQKSLRQLE